MPDYTEIPYIKFHPSRAIFYTRLDPEPTHSHNSTSFTELHEAKQPPLLSRKAKTRLQLAINTMTELSRWKKVKKPDTKKFFPFKINFITLTLPAATKMTDREITKKALSEFLRKWKKRNPKLLYVWKAEVQDNGRLHYHLTTNQYYHAKKLRRDWNKQLQKIGIEHPKLSTQANSTDVHAVKNIKNLAAYLTTYMGKKDLYKKPLKRYFRRYGRKLKRTTEKAQKLPKRYYQNIKRKPKCKLWDCSKSLHDTCITLQYNDTATIHEQDYIQESREPLIQDEYFAFFPIDKKTRKHCPKLYNKWKTAMLNKVAQEAGAKRYNKDLL